MTNKEVLRLAYAKFYNEDVRQILKDFNLSVYKPENICNMSGYKFYDKELSLKKELMQKFLSIFGIFKWQKYKSFFDIKDFIILPNKLSLDYDDCVIGKYEDIGIRITEVYIGMNYYKNLSIRHGNMGVCIGLIWFCIFLYFISTKVFSFSIALCLFFGGGFAFLIYMLILLIIFAVNYINRGVIIEIDMPKNFKGETVLFENALTNLSVDKKALKRFEKTQLEDTEFNKKYSIYTNNQIEARYVLTTAFIEHLKNIKFRFDARYLRMRFKNNRIAIFASVNKDLFQMVKSGQKTDMKTFDVLFEEIYSVLSLVDELKLNVKTGL